MLSLFFPSLPNMLNQSWKDSPCNCGIKIINKNTSELFYSTTFSYDADKIWANTCVLSSKAALWRKD